MRPILRSSILLAVGTMTMACASSPPPSTKVPPVPILLLWPEPAFLPERQCQGTYPSQDLEHYLPEARLALQIPSTQTVALDPERRCIVVVVESVGAARLVELLLSGIAVPRDAVLLKLAGYKPLG